jgi:hypothetical protein
MRSHRFSIKLTSSNDIKLSQCSSGAVAVGSGVGDLQWL